MYCRVCGNLLEESDLICKVCGADIKEQQRSAADEAAFAGVSATERAKEDSASRRVEASISVARDPSPSLKAVDLGADSAPESGEPSDTAPANAEVPGAEAALASERSADQAGAEAETDPGAAEEPEAAEEPGSAGFEAAGSKDAEAAMPRLKPSSGEFHWNIHKFPSPAARKTEDINFDWGLSPSSLQFKESPDDSWALAGDDAPEDVHAKTVKEFYAIYEASAAAEDAGDASAEAFARIEEGLDDSAKPLAPGDADARIQDFLAVDAPAENREKTVDLTCLRAQSPQEQRDAPLAPDAARPEQGRFFTFDQKNAEFQKLLDREYERLRAYDSPIVNEARELLAAWDWPGFAGKRTGSATERRPRPAFYEQSEQGRDRGAPADKADAKEEPAALAAETPSADADTPDAGEPLAEEVTRDAGFPAAGEPLAEEEAGLASDAGAAEDGAAIKEQAAPGANDASAGTEAELSINKALDSIEKEIQEWQSRDRLSTASKAAMVVAVIFLLFTGGAAAAKYLAPHSPADLWFDSVQLQAAVTIKHGVDALRDMFDNDDDTEDGTAGGEQAGGTDPKNDEPGAEGAAGGESETEGGTADPKNDEPDGDGTDAENILPGAPADEGAAANGIN
jgi:hypothetical protein